MGTTGMPANNHPKTPTEAVLLEVINVVDSMLRIATNGQLLGITLAVWPMHEGEKASIASNVPKEARGEVRDALEAVLERWNASDH